MGLGGIGAGLFPRIRYRCTLCGEEVTTASRMTTDGREYHSDGGLLERITGALKDRDAADDPQAWEKWPE